MLSTTMKYLICKNALPPNLERRAITRCCVKHLQLFLYYQARHVCTVTSSSLIMRTDFYCGPWILPKNADGWLLSRAEPHRRFLAILQRLVLAKCDERDESRLSTPIHRRQCAATHCCVSWRL